MSKDIKETRLESEQLAELREDIVATKLAVAITAGEAVTEICAISGVFEVVMPSDTPVVVVEMRQDDQLGEYAVVGHLNVDESSQPEYQVVQAKYGIAFRQRTGVDSPIDTRLGAGIDGTIWHGTWLESSIEASDHRDVREGISNLSRLAGDRHLIWEPEQLHEHATTKLASVDESVDAILTAARNPELNPRLGIQNYDGFSVHRYSVHGIKYHLISAESLSKLAIGNPGFVTRMVRGLGKLSLTSSQFKDVVEGDIFAFETDNLRKYNQSDENVFLVAEKLGTLVNRLATGEPPFTGRTGLGTKATELFRAAYEQVTALGIPQEEDL